jgi:hypothetical protein
VGFGGGVDADEPAAFSTYSRNVEHWSAFRTVPVVF